MDRPKLNQIGALRAIAKAAHDFRVNVNCYSVGVSLLSEERMKVLDAELQEAFQALVDAREWDRLHPIDPSRLPPKLTDLLEAASLESRSVRKLHHPTCSFKADEAPCGCPTAGATYSAQDDNNKGDKNG